MFSREFPGISLTPEPRAFVADMMKAGGYVSFSEVVRVGLRLMQERKGNVPAPGAAPSPTAKH